MEVFAGLYVYSAILELSGRLPGSKEFEAGVFSCNTIVKLSGKAPEVMGTLLALS